jgi:uncharacterized circularly permuted ATP-grasp superfamily protein/uncharacterized alpha-E superfamily protein
VSGVENLLETGDPLDLVLRQYRSKAGQGDLMLGAEPAMAANWSATLSALADPRRGGFTALQERAGQQVLDLGMAFRLAGDADERVWPLSPVPLLLSRQDWATLQDGLAQRAELLEAVLEDVYGEGRLIASGELPAAAIAGSLDYWRQMQGLRPPYGRRLQFLAFDLGRGPDGEWRVLADHARTPVGAGYALENRLAMTRATNDLFAQMNLMRLAPFFTDFRQGLAATCERVDPRIALLTPGRLNPSYPEQAHLARYLGLLLVEGDDLVVREGKLYVRTIAGLKRIDAIWRRMTTQLLDPLAFDAHSTIGIPDLFEAVKSGGLAVANWPGCGFVEAPLLAAFMPRLCELLTGRPLKIPNIATWWCGQEAERAQVGEQFDRLAIGPAFGRSMLAFPNGRPRLATRFGPKEREDVLAAMARRPADFIGQELVQLSTTPALVDGQLLPRPFILRMFLARDGDGRWRAMPGGFARLAAHDDMRAVLMGEGDMSADVCVLGEEPSPPSRLGTPDGMIASPVIRRVAGTLPSKAADNLFWLARYLERGEIVLRMVRLLLGGRLEADSAATLDHATLRRVADTLLAWGAARPDVIDEDVHSLCASALSDTDIAGSVQSLFMSAETIGKGLRERLAVDFWRLLSRQHGAPPEGPAHLLLAHVARLLDRCAALSGLAAENMVRGAGWRFLDMGRRIERAVHIARLVRSFGRDEASADDLNLLLDLCDSQISFRTRYLAGVALAPVRDMLVLEPANPRSLAFQIDRIVGHLKELPFLKDDGMPEPPMRMATSIAARLAAADADLFDDADLAFIEAHLLDLSDAISARFFPKGEDAPRASGMTRLA